MSAFLVPEVHIQVLVQAGIQWPTDDRFGGNRDELAAALLEENHRSVNYRYGHADPEPVAPIRFQPAEIVLEGHAVLKAVRCYVFQSCEHPGFRDSAPAVYLAELERNIAAALGARPDWNVYATCPKFRAADTWPVESWDDVAHCPRWTDDRP